MKFSIVAPALDPMNCACSGPARGRHGTERAVLREMRFDEVLIEGKPSGRALRKRRLSEQQRDKRECSESVHSGHRNAMGSTGQHSSNITVARVKGYSDRLTLLYSQTKSLTR
jgi:hypothetical protein